MKTGFRFLLSNFVNAQLKQPQQKRVRGYTLSEILVAGFLSSVVLSVSGMGIVSVMSASRANNAKSERRVEIDRSLGFITSEIQQAFQINPVNAPVPDNPDATNEQGVFQLAIPGLPNPIIYYTANPAGTWIGPKVIYRWGPGYDADFNYDSDPARWSHQPLIDLIEDSPQPLVACYIDPTNSSQNWTQTPSSAPAGLYGCIDPTRRIVKIFHQGRVYTANTHQLYTAEEQAFARASTGLDPSKNFQISQGRLLIPSSSSIRFEILGSDLRCGRGGTPVLTQLALNISQPNAPQNVRQYQISPQTNPPTVQEIDPNTNTLGGIIPNIITGTLPAGTVLDFTGLVQPITSNPNNICLLENTSNFLGFNSVSHPNQVKVLKNGDIVPSLEPFGPNAPSIEQFAANYLVQGTDPVTGQAVYRVQVPDPDRQAIILFELGVVNTNSPAFDLQDIVLLATINP
jgi:Tfp pilus assembly protein PilW